MRYFSVMIKPASSLCNLRCKYCFYADVSNLRKIKSYGIMSSSTARKMIANIFCDLEDSDTITFAFQGGEPTLAGLSFFRDFIRAVDEEKSRNRKKTSVSYSLQTNGTMLDDEWCSFLAENHFLVGLSLDGSAEFHNANRVDDTQKGTYARVMQAKHCLERHHVEYNILWVLTARHAQHPKKAWDFICSQNIEYVQFVPCLSELQGERPSPYSLTPQRFSSFYTQLFQYWEQDLRKGKYRSIKFFDDIFNLLLRHEVTACGFTGHCQPQFIVEADGSVYPCDFYVLDEWKSGNFTENTITEIANSSKTAEFLSRPRPNPPICAKCRWKNMCGGGCPRMHSNMYVNAAGTFCGYQDFLNQNAVRLERIACDLEAHRI